MFRHFIQHTSASYKVIILTGLYMLILYFIPLDFKIGFVSSLLFAFFLFTVTRNLFLSLFIIFLASSQFVSPAKSYPFELISSGEYIYELLPNGIFETINITITDLFAYFLMIFLIKTTIAYTFRNIIMLVHPAITMSVMAFLFHIFLSLYSTLYLSPFPLFSLITLLHHGELAIAALSVIHLLNNHKNFSFLYFSLIVSFFVQCTIGVIQLFNTLMATSLQIGAPTLDAEQTVPIMRSGGVGDPNSHGLVVAVLFSLIFPYALSVRNKFLINSIVFLAILNIISSQSRSVWSGCILIVIITLFVHKNLFTHIVLQFHSHKRKLVYMGGFLVLIGTIVIPRIIYSQSFFTEEGGGSLRIKMIKEGVQLLIQSPVVGFGPGVTVRALFDNIPNGYVHTFPFPVHTAYLQIALESGLPALLAFLVPFYLVLRGWFFRINLQSQTTMLFYGVGCAQIIIFTYFLSQPIYAYARSAFAIIGISLGMGLSFLYANVPLSKKRGS